MSQKTKPVLTELRSIRIITKNQFSVDSQTDNTKSYLVKKLPTQIFGLVNVQISITD